MRKSKKVIAVLLSLAMTVGSVSNFRTFTLAAEKNLGENVINQEEFNPLEYDYLALNEEVADRGSLATKEDMMLAEYYMSSATAKSDALEEVVYPSKLDLSKSEYFPGIKNQGHNGSCFFYATFYLNLTFANNRARNQKATENNMINPMFGFNYASLVGTDTYKMVEDIGFVTIGNSELNINEYKNLYPTKEAWESAMKHRPAEIQSLYNFGKEDSIVEGPKDPSLNQIKHTLNEGLLVSTGCLVSMWNTSVVASGEHKGELAIDRCDGEYGGGHVVVLVGYDDDIWIDINLDGEVQPVELGAFKIANSWGDGWANDGFIWLAYDALNETSQVLTAEDEVRINKMIKNGELKALNVNSKQRKSYFMFDTYTRMETRENETSGCACYMTVNTGSRREMIMSVQATHKESGEKYTYDFPRIINESENYSWDGKEKSTDGTMVFDLENVVEDITPETMDDYDWEVTFADDEKDEYSLTVKDVYFAVNDSKKYVTSVSKLPLNGNSRTYKMNIRRSDLEEDPVIAEENKKNVTIYYNNSAYENANIHYRVGSGSWTTVPGLQMCESYEQSGYKWKYVVNLGDASKMNLCFNEEGDNWDNNSSKDYTISAPGVYGIKDGKIVELEEVAEEPEVFIEFNQESYEMNIGDEKILKPTVINALTSDIEWSSSDEKIATVSKEGKVIALGAGKVTITAKIGDVSENVSVVINKSEPLIGMLLVSGTAEEITKEVGSEVLLDAMAGGGSMNYTFKFAVLNVDTGKWTVLQDFSKNSSYKVTLKYPGTKQFALTIKDSAGNTLSAKRVTVEVIDSKNNLSGSLKVNNSTSSLTKVKGSKITLNALGYGGSGNYTYKFAVLNVNTKKWSVLRNFSSNSSYTYSLDYSGTKQFAVTVKDSKGDTVATNRITVKVTNVGESLSANLKVDNSTVSLVKVKGSKITLNADAVGGSGEYTYKFAVLNADTGKWSVLRNFSSNSSYTYSLNYTGTKQFAVTVKDSTGKTVATNRITVLVID